MPQPAAQNQPYARKMRMVAVVAVLAGIALGIAVLTVGVIHQIDTQSSATSDNIQWSLSQVDVELLTLTLALDDAIDQPSKLMVARTRFDVFFSRINTLHVGSVFANLRQGPEFSASLGRLHLFVTQTTPLMDGADEDLRRALPEISHRAHDLFADSHQIALEGVSTFARLTDLRRAAVKFTLIELALLTLVLVAALAAMLWRVVRLGQVNQLKAAENIATLTRLDAVVATSLDAVITLDDHGRITEFNQAAVQTFGYRRDEALGQALTLVIPLTADGHPQLPPRNETPESNQRRRRVTARHRFGHIFPAEVSLASARAGRVHVVFLRDLSQQLAAEQALVTARDEALAGEKAKADLLVVMSHEIRTPLNGMIGTMDLLDSTALAPHQREYLRIMAASGRLLMHHVNDVLDIARLDSGKASLNLTPVDLALLVREVIENQSPTSLANGNVLTFTPAPDGRSLVMCDGAMVRQVMMNLVGNAVKFTHNGRVTVELAHLSPHGPTEIIVRDTGIGVPPEDLGRIFEDFVTLDPSYARRASGTGLGLGIVRRIVTRMGGKITVDSVPGAGSTFCVSLPLILLDAAPPEPQAAAVVAKLGGLSVLVVEDNDFNRLIVRHMLLAEQHRVTEAHDGLEGVRLADERRYDVILMDISMPGIDGLQAAQRITQGHGASRATPIVALTAHALHEETERFRAGGMADVLIKPITRETLRKVLAGLPRPQLARSADIAKWDDVAKWAGVARSAEVTKPADVANLAEVARPAEVLMDLKTLAELRAGLGVEKAFDLITRFLTDTDHKLSELTQSAPDEADDGDFVSEVHRMTGTAAMFGAVRFHRQLTLIEDLCKTGKRAEACAEVPGLTALWQQTAAAYRAIGSLAQASSLR